MPAKAVAEDDEVEGDDHDECCDAIQQRLAHLLEASRHLELAGMKDEAQRLRESCVAEVSDLVRRLKSAEAELESLRSEAVIARPASLETPLPRPLPADSGCNKNRGTKQVVANLKMLELDLTRARKLDAVYTTESGKEFALDDFVTGRGVLKPILNEDEAQAFDGLIELLREQCAATTLCDPTVMTTDGRSAHFAVGGEFPVPSFGKSKNEKIKFREFGTSVELRPTILDGNNLRLEVHPRIAEIDESRSIQVAECIVPGLLFHEADSAVELRTGQTAILLGDVENRIESSCVCSLGSRTEPFPLEAQIIGFLDGLGIAAPWVNKRVTCEEHEIVFVVVVRPEIVETCGNSMKLGGDSAACKGHCNPQRECTESACRLPAAECPATLPQPATASDFPPLPMPPF
ncbi:MAG: hypothetical protein IT427_14160 [Pirellulales bacterium]|nr:hypothetical protein [Pirellulales bacterium]